MADSILNFYIVLLQKLLYHLHELINMAMGVMTYRMENGGYSVRAGLLKL